MNLVKVHHPYGLWMTLKMWIVVQFAKVPIGP